MAKPNYQQLFSSSANDGWSLLLRRKNFLAILLVVVTIGAAIAGLAGGAFLARAPSFAAANTYETVLSATYFFAFLVPGTYAVADSVRTIYPDFRITFLRFLGVAGYFGLFFLAYFGVVVFAAISAFLLRIPLPLVLVLTLIACVWVFVRVSQTLYVYLLRPGFGAISASWEITKEHFWETFGFYILLALITWVGTQVPFFVALQGAHFAAASVIVFVPFMFGIVTYMMYFNHLVHVRWSEALLEAHDTAFQERYAIPPRLPEIP